MQKKIDKNHYKIMKNIIDNDNLNMFKSYITINNIDINCNFSISEKESDSLIFYAVRKSKLNIIKHLMLIDEIKINTPNTNQTTPILHSIAFKKEEIFDLLIKHPNPGLKYAGDLDEKNNTTTKMYPLTRASQARSLKMVKAIAEHPDNNFKLCGNQPYFYALSNKQTEIGLYLVNHVDFDPYTQAGGRNAYKFACETQNRKVLKAVLNLPQFNPSIPLEDKFKMDEKDKTKFEPLWWEPFRFISNLDNGRKLSDIILNHHKIDVNQKDETGKRLIDHHLTVNIQHVAFELLIENKNVDIYNINLNGRNLLEEILLSFKKSDILNHIYERRVKSLVDRIITEKAEIINEQCERLVELNISNSHKDYALGILRYALIKKSINKKTNNSIKKATHKI